MIRISLSAGRLVQRLRARAGRIASQHVSARRRDAFSRPNWRSAEALWPDLFGEHRDGK
jgi:hypothetical protein